MLCKQKQKMSNLRISQNHKGLTLVEVIAMIAVLSVVMAVVAGFMISGANMSAKVSTNAGASIREQTAVEFINNESQCTVARYIASGAEVVHGDVEGNHEGLLLLAEAQHGLQHSQSGHDGTTRHAGSSNHDHPQHQDKA